MTKSIIEKIHYSICLSSRDFAQNPIDAFLYGLVVGWGGKEAEKDEPGSTERIHQELSKKFGWTKDDWQIIDQIHRSLELKQQKIEVQSNRVRDRILSPEDTIKAIANEPRITIVWEHGFEEKSPTTKAFLEFYGEEQVEKYCLNAHLGQPFKHTIFRTNGKLAQSEAEELIRASEYSYVRLDTKKNPFNPNYYIVIENLILNEKKIQKFIQKNTLSPEEIIKEAEDKMKEVLNWLKGCKLDYLSVSTIQRRFKIGYHVASRIQDNLEQMGYLEAFSGNPRGLKILRKE